MAPEVFGYSNLEWLVGIGNASLWQAQSGEDVNFLVQISNFGPSFASWLFCFESKAILLKQRRGQPILRLFAENSIEANAILRQAHKTILQQQRSVRFFADIGWKALDPEVTFEG
jgi:hypothetical protein